MITGSESDDFFGGLEACSDGYITAEAGGESSEGESRDSNLVSFGLGVRCRLFRRTTELLSVSTR